MAIEFIIIVACVVASFLIGMAYGIDIHQRASKWRIDTIHSQAKVISRMHARIRRLKRKIWRGF